MQPKVFQYVPSSYMLAFFFAGAGASEDLDFAAGAATSLEALCTGTCGSVTGCTTAPSPVASMSCTGWLACAGSCADGAGS